MTIKALKSAFEWGQQQGWDLIELAHWDNRIPQGIAIDGLISCFSHDAWPLARKLHRQIPAGVGIACEALYDICPTLAMSHETVALQAADYYLGRGFKNFAIAAILKRGLSERLKLFEQHVQMKGGTCGRITGLESSGMGAVEARNQFFKQFQEFELPLAIFCVNDYLAAKVCRWLIDEHIAIPEQVSVLGVGNSHVASHSSPVPLSSVDAQPEKQGIEAAKLLERILNGERIPPGPAYIPSGGVVTRRSTDITAASNLTVARALRLIWDEYRRDITPEEIAKACGIPRRSLDRNFKKEIGRSIPQEIKHRRLLFACDLLLSSNGAIVDIAAEAGFRSAQHFNLLFKKSYGMPPKQWRERERNTRTH
jgi:LacI family transcriptional regulator